MFITQTVLHPKPVLCPFLFLVFHRSHLLIATLAAGLIAAASFIDALCGGFPRN